jgi:hypothetical protein
MLKISKAPVDAKTMTASDYIEIQQLLARYPYGLDTGQRHGQMWVDVFTPDATFNKAQGSEALMKIARHGGICQLATSSSPCHRQGNSLRSVSRGCTGTNPLALTVRRLHIPWDRSRPC